MIFISLYEKGKKHESVADREFPVLDIYKCPFSEMAVPPMRKT